jgi:hypothetical protein
MNAMSWMQVFRPEFALLDASTECTIAKHDRKYGRSFPGKAAELKVQAEDSPWKVAVRLAKMFLGREILYDGSIRRHWSPAAA